MRYFFMSQDTMLPKTIKFRDFDITGGRMIFTRKESLHMKDSAELYLEGTGREVRPDLIQSPITMCSDRLRDILNAYEEGLIFKEVSLIHQENSLLYSYVQILMEHLDALSEKTEFYSNGMPKQIILDKKKIGSHQIFRLDGPYRKDPIISMPLAESLLRRDIMGVKIEEVEVI